MISVDEPEKNKRFAEQEGADFPFLSDPTKQVATAYGVLNASGSANRWTFYIGGDGKFLFIDKGTGRTQTDDAGATMTAKLEELAGKGLIKRKK
jgi:peroxiredoxin Q/BCP